MVLLDLHEDFKAKMIQLQIYGCEESSFSLLKPPEKSTKKDELETFESKTDICFIKIDFKEVFDDTQQKGQFTFPFEIQLPDWLPASMLLTN